jgi:hypothetical protein
MPSLTPNSGTPTAADRRTSLRVALDVPALLDSDRAHHSGRCRDVSTGGVAVSVEAAVPVGTEFDVYFELPSGLAVEARAIVVRASHDGLALRFVDVSARTRVALRAFCRPSGVGLNRLAVKFNA